MVDRRVSLGVGAILAGVGSALISAAGIAAADTPDTAPGTSSASADRASASSAAPSRGASTHSRVRTAADRPARVAKNDAPVVPREVSAPDAATTRPAAASLSRIFSARGGRPGADSTAASPALAPAATRRQAVTAGAVIVSPAVAGDPPDPTLFAAATADPLLSGPQNGVTGVQVGYSRLAIPGAFIGNTVGADWYFPTRADGTVDAQGVIYLQHGLFGFSWPYTKLATELAKQTNSIVVALTLSSLPFTFSGGCLTCSTSQQAVADAFLDPDRTVLVASAQDAGYTGDVSELQGAFVLSGHSAGGGFAIGAAADYISGLADAQSDDLVGVLGFDAVSNGVSDGSLDDELATLGTGDTPIYQIAAPTQWINLYGSTTNALLAARPGRFDGVVLVDGLHVDSMLGTNPILDFVAQLGALAVSPKGNTEAAYAFSTGWINDWYVGATPDAPQYGLYAAADQQISVGDAAAVGLPTPIANQLFPVAPFNTVIKILVDAVDSIFGLTTVPPVNTGTNGIVAPRGS